MWRFIYRSSLIYGIGSVEASQNKELETRWAGSSGIKLNNTVHHENALRDFSGH